MIWYLTTLSYPPGSRLPLLNGPHHYLIQWLTSNGRDAAHLPMSSTSKNCNFWPCNQWHSYKIIFTVISNELIDVVVVCYIQVHWVDCKLAWCTNHCQTMHPGFWLMTSTLSTTTAIAYFDHHLTGHLLYCRHTPALAFLENTCRMLWHCICDKTKATDSFSNNWKHFYFRVRYSRSIVTRDSCTVEITSGGSKGRPRGPRPPPQSGPPLALQMKVLVNVIEILGQKFIDYMLV